MKRVMVAQSMFLLSIIGGIVSGAYTYSGRINASLGFAMTLVFVLMFISSLVTMTPTKEEMMAIK